MILIGLVGGAASGKTTVADYLVNKYGAVKLAFATPLKKLLTRAFHLPEESLYGSQAEKETVLEQWGISGREFMTRVGQASRDTFGDDFWVRECLRRVDESGAKLVVIEDVRYINEANAIKLWGMQYKQHPSYLIRLECPWRQTKANQKHLSESEWSTAPYDVKIVSEEPDLEALYRKIDDAASAFGI